MFGNARWLLGEGLNKGCLQRYIRRWLRRRAAQDSLEQICSCIKRGERFLGCIVRPAGILRASECCIVGNEVQQTLVSRRSVLSQLVQALGAY